MKKIIRLTESDLTRIVKRVIMEQKTHQGLYELEKQLKPFGFVKEPELMAVSKGSDDNGAFIQYRQHELDANGKKVSDDKYVLVVTINGKHKIYKEYKLTPPNYMIDVTKIINDLGDYKNYKF